MESSQKEIVIDSGFVQSKNHAQIVNVSVVKRWWRNCSLHKKGQRFSLIQRRILHMLCTDSQLYW